MQNQINGQRVRNYFSNDVKSMLEAYKHFETLIPSSTNQNGSDHNGEDGRYVEDLLREYFKKFLPANLEVLTGFIFRPAVRTNYDYEDRSYEEDQHSPQLDIIIYDSSIYPIFQRFGNSAIVPPEGVIAVISVKKHLYKSKLKNELKALYKVAELCGNCFKDSKNNDIKLRGPFLSIISIDQYDSEITSKDFQTYIEELETELETELKTELKTELEKKKSKLEGEKAKLEKKETSEELEKITNNLENIKKQLSPTNTNSFFSFDHLIGHIGILKKYSIFKKRPNQENGNEAEYVSLKHDTDDEYHLGFQLTLTGILSVFYDETRHNIRRPGFTAFLRGSTSFCKIKYKDLRV